MHMMDALKCIILILFLHVFGKYTTATVPLLNFDPSIISVGLTESIKLTCSILNEAMPSVAQIFSILVLQASDKESANFNDVAAINSFSGIIKSNNMKNMHNEGQINNTGLSYLNISWLYLDERNAGVYRCEVNGVSTIGKPVTFTNNVRIPTSLPTIDIAIKEIKSLRERSQVVQNSIHELELKWQEKFSKLLINISELTKQQSSFIGNSQIRESNLTQNMKELFTNQAQIIETKVLLATNKFEIFLRTLNMSRNKYFMQSDHFQGRRYLLTREAIFIYPSFAQSICALFGGYLAEIDTHAEFDFTRNFILKYGAFHKFVMAGGTDEAQKGSWINRHSKTAVASFWGSGQPNNNGENQHCQYFDKDNYWYLNDIECVFTNTINIGFLCEVAETLV